MEEEKVEAFKAYNKELRTKGLVISRLPIDVREGIVKMSNESFCGDYGMCIKFLFDQCVEYQFMKGELFANADIKLNHIITLLGNESNSSQEKKRTTLSGKEITRN